MTSLHGKQSYTEFLDAKQKLYGTLPFYISPQLDPNFWSQNNSYDEKYYNYDLQRD
jgi:hypothetical protein